MFSNWLTPSISTNAPPPDVILEIGPPPYSRFVAHSALLAAHSGYLRSAIRPDDRHLESPVYLPNVTADQFSPLLTYMYTGFLDLTMENIFGVLLATHILHMPRALEICRSFLARSQSEGYFGSAFFASSMVDKSVLPVSAEGGVKVIRPIASKATGPALGFVAAPHPNTLLSSHDTPFKSLHLPPVIHPPPQPEKPAPSPVAGTSKRSQSPKEAPIPKKVARTHKRTHQGKPKMKVPRKPIEIETVANAVEVSAVIEEASKTIIDVASCDGPVRFHRVLNDAYGRVPVHSRASASKPPERTHEHVATSFHMQMARTISERQAVSAAESENSQEIVVHEQPEQAATGTSCSGSAINGKQEEVYSCVYCKHTFKSQYCYQKHAKRHINPLSIDGELVVETLDSGSEKDEKCGKTSAVAKREVRPLDMNVQYYPCKTCGSKFPSYYFVHKHRKMCHANEEN